MRSVSFDVECMVMISRVWKLIKDIVVAFHSGRAKVVVRLYQCVCYHAGLRHIPFEVVRRQMEREFPGVQLGDVPLDWISSMPEGCPPRIGGQ